MKQYKSPWEVLGKPKEVPHCPECGSLLAEKQDDAIFGRWAFYCPRCGYEEM